MTQAEVLEFMEESGEWLSPRQIAINMGVSYGSVTAALPKLLKQGYVKTKRNPNKMLGYLWRYIG